MRRSWVQTMVAAVPLTIAVMTAAALVWHGSVGAAPRPSSLSSATTSPSPASSPSPSAPAARYAPPPPNAEVDYQIGGAYRPPAGVGVVTRDHTAAPAPGVYNVCYVNAYESQPDARTWWTAHHSDLLLHAANGSVVMDRDEALLDISTPARRTALLGVVGGWIDECAAKGFRAVEPDNLDSWTRSGGRLTQAQAVAFATLLTGYAHDKGLAVAQKNTVEIAAIGPDQIGFDFAVVERCAEDDQCQGYIDAYRDHVIVIEYTDAGFERACGRYGGSLSVVQRDRDVTTPGSASYRYRSC